MLVILQTVLVLHLNKVNLQWQRQCWWCCALHKRTNACVATQGGRRKRLIAVAASWELTIRGDITRITRLLRITRIAGLIFKDNHKSFQRSLFTQITNHSFDFEVSGFSPSHPCKLPQFFLDAISCKFDISDFSLQFHFWGQWCHLCPSFSLYLINNG